MTKTKRAQVTAFLLIGIVLLLLYGIYAGYQNFKLSPEKEEEAALVHIPGKAKPVKIFVDQCIEQMMLPGINMMALQGGFLYLPKNVLSTDYATVAYWYSDALTIPTILDMEHQLKQYAEEAVPQCLNELSSFKQRWQEIDTGTFSARVTITNETVSFKFGYPINLTDQLGTYHMENFTLRVPVKLGYAHDLLRKAVEQFAAEQPWIDVTALSAEGTNAQVMPIDENRFILMMTDNSTLVKDRQFQFLVAVSFIPNQPPRIVAGDLYQLIEEQEFTVQWSVVDEDPASVVFKENTMLFEIQPNGLVRFIPHVPGTFEFEVTVTDRQGKWDTKKVTFIVEEQH